MQSPFEAVPGANAAELPVSRIRLFGWYLAASAFGHGVWEVAQLPLYTIWTTGTAARQVFAIVHCTAGDVLIAAWTLGLAVLLLRNWSSQHKTSMIAVATIVLGVLYTGFSEWRNVYVEGSWAYNGLMPTVMIGGYAIGLSPLVQWVIVPSIALWFALRRHWAGVQNV